MTLKEKENVRLDLQTAIDANKTLDERRRMGQFATPGALASAIVRETVPYLKGKGRLTALEPSMGTGAFVSAMLSVLGKRLVKVRACELETPDATFKRAISRRRNQSAWQMWFLPILRMYGTMRLVLSASGIFSHWCCVALDFAFQDSPGCTVIFCFFRGRG